MKLVIELDDWNKDRESAGAAKVRLMRSCHIFLTKHLQARSRAPVPEPPVEAVPPPRKRGRPRKVQ